VVKPPPGLSDRLDEQLQYGNVELKQAQHVQVGS
jgi:hypothetical protein